MSRTAPKDMTVEAALDPVNWSAFLRAAALRFEEVGADGVRGALEVDEAHHQPWGIVHGGVWASAAETAASMGAATFAAGLGLTAVGVSNSTDFLRPVRAGRVDLVAVPVQQGRTQQLWTVTLSRAEDAKPVAVSRVRLQNVAPPGAAR